MSKSKGKHQKSGVKLFDALLQYNAKNYAGALKRLRIADLREGEAQRAKQLEYACLLRLAHEEIGAYRFEEALTFLKGLDAADARVAAFKGIAYFYLQDFASADPLLMQAADTYPSFSFYFLVCRVWHAKVAQLSGSMDIKYLLACTEPQEAYLAWLNELLGGGAEGGMKYMASVEPENFDQKANFAALGCLVGHPDYPSASFSDRVKPLYRLLGQASLRADEKNYLKLFQAKLPNLEALMEVKGKMGDVLVRDMQAQLEEDKMLDQRTLEAILNKTPEAMRPMVVYNHAAMAYNQEDMDILEGEIYYVLTKHLSDFVQVPESMPVLFKVFMLEGLPTMTGKLFWRAFRMYADIWLDTLSPENLHHLERKLLTYLAADETEHDHRRDMLELSRKYPHVFAFKLYAFIVPKDPFRREIPNLDFFHFPYSELNRQLFIEHFDDAIHGFVRVGAKIFNPDYRMELKVSTAVLDTYENQLFLASQMPNLDTGNIILLDGYKVLAKHFARVNSDMNTELKKSVKHIYDRFVGRYANLIERFATHPEMDDYRQDLKGMDSGAATDELAALFNKDSKGKNLPQLLAKHGDIGNFNYVWDYFIAVIDKAHFEKETALSLARVLEQIYIFLKDEVAAAKAFETFIHRYRNFCHRVNCEHPTDFYAWLTIEVAKSKHLTSALIYKIAEGYMEEMAQYEPISKPCINAMVILQNMFLEQNKNTHLRDFPNINKHIIRNFIDYLEITNDQKLRAKIGEILKKAAKK